MSCLDDIIDGSRVIIGIKDYASCTDPESNLFLNRDLPGITLKSVASINPEAWQSGAQFMKDCTILAARHVFDEFANELQPYFDFRNIVETRELRVFKTSLNGVSATERGIVVKRWRSEAARLFIESVFINVESGGSATIKIIDGSHTEEKTVDLDAGINEILFEYKAESEQVKIVFDQTGFQTFDGAWNRTGSCSSCGGSSGKGIYVTGWNGTQESSNTYGVGVKVHAQCYEENILCSLLPKMYFLMLYKSGILVLKERIATDRINHIAIFGREKAEELLADYEATYKEKYAMLVKSAYNYLMSTKGECVKCNNIRYVQSTP